MLKKYVLKTWTYVGPVEGRDASCPNTFVQGGDSPEVGDKCFLPPGNSNRKNKVLPETPLPREGPGQVWHREPPDAVKMITGLTHLFSNLVRQGAYIGGCLLRAHLLPRREGTDGKKNNGIGSFSYRSQPQVDHTC